MKKYRVQIISGVVTITVLIIITLCFTYFLGVKASYHLSSEISFSNKNGIIDGYIVDYSDSENEDGDFELKIEIGSQEERVIDFEISALVNYKQQHFTTLNSDNRVLSSVISVEQNSKDIIMIIDKDAFEQYQNELVINIRQDIKELSYKNELVRDSNTINYTFYILNKENKKDSQVNEQENIIKNIIETPLEDTSQNIVFEISAENNDGPLIKSIRHEDIPINVSIGGNKAREYLIWANLDSKQTNINGNPYAIVEINENMIGNVNLNIENSMKPGIYELEIYCVPFPYEEAGNTLKEIISAKRYTVKVE